jgi:hypothetical protein
VNSLITASYPCASSDPSAPAQRTSAEIAQPRAGLHPASALFSFPPANQSSSPPVPILLLQGEPERRKLSPSLPASLAPAPTSTHRLQLHVPAAASHFTLLMRRARAQLSDIAGSSLLTPAITHCQPQLFPQHLASRIYSLFHIIVIQLFSAPPSRSTSVHK